MFQFFPIRNCKTFLVTYLTLFISKTTSYVLVSFWCITNYPKTQLLKTMMNNYFSVFPRLCGFARLVLRSSLSILGLSHWRVWGLTWNGCDDLVRTAGCLSLPMALSSSIPAQVSLHGGKKIPIGNGESPMLTSLLIPWII